MGNEFAGIVEKTGKNATRLQVGDRVYGRMPLKKIGAFAEYAAVEKMRLHAYRSICPLKRQRLSP